MGGAEMRWLTSKGEAACEWEPARPQLEVPAHVQETEQSFKQPEETSILVGKNKRAGVRRVFCLHHQPNKTKGCICMLEVEGEDLCTAVQQEA
jgi:hypothetical protein